MNPLEDGSECVSGVLALRLSPTRSDLHPIESDRLAIGHAAAEKRIRRAFAILAASAMVLTAFAILSRTVAADTTSSPGSIAPSANVAGRGFTVSAGQGGSTSSFLGTFQRWDGAYLPMAFLNLSAGNWPYLLHEDANSFTITRLGDNFTQARVPGAVYEFRPDAIKETIVIPGPSAVPFDAIGIGFQGSYLPYASGTTVELIDRHGGVAWQSEGFTAEDSSPTPRRYPNPVQSVSWSPGGLTVRLDPSMVTWAQYPLYLDPTWVLKGSTSNVWSGTLDSVTSDWGDHNLRLGVLADNFNDNVNEVWTLTSGHSFSLSGGRGLLTATEIHASGSWSNLTLGATINFASCGASNLFFRYASSSNYYYLYVNFANQQVTLNKVINGVTTALSSTLSIPMSANTNYDVRVVARGNAFEIWWAGVRKWGGTDPSPPGSPLSGNVGISETTSQCTLYVDNVRARDPAKWSGNYTAVKRGAASGNVATQVRFLGMADAYNATDLWINSASDNTTWGGWHLVKSMAAPGFYYPIPDVDRKRYYQIRAVLRTGVDGTSAVQEIDVTEASPPSIVATTNTGRVPWYVYVGGEVNAVSGNLFLSFPDLSIQARGGPISIARTYNSLLAGMAGPFGLGTMDAFHEKLAFPSGGNVTLTAGDGAVYTYVTMGGNAFSPPPGIHANLVKNADGSYTLWQPDGSRVNFDSTGKLTSTVDRNGNHLTLTYTNGNPTRIADDSGLALTLNYDGNNRVKNVTDPVGRKFQYTYDASGRLNQSKDPMGFTENYTYDASSRLNQSVDRAGHVDRFLYDSNGRVYQVWIGEWNSVTRSIRWQLKEYALAFPSGTQTTVTNALGGVTTIALNSAGNPTNISGPGIGCGLCSGGNSTAYAWDGEFDRLTVTDGRGDTKSYAYDWIGNTLSSRDPGGNMTIRTYQNVQNVTQFISLPMSTTTPRGFTDRYTYYANGNPYSTTQPDNSVAYRFYDAAGSLTRTQDFRGNSVTYGYDAHEFQINSSDAGGNRTTFQNDGIGRTWNVTSPGGNVTRKVFDVDNRVTSATDPMGNTTTFGYDKDGRTTKVTDPNNLVTTSTYNLTLGGLQTRVSPGNNMTRYVYDSLGDRVQTLVAGRNQGTYSYDSFRRVANGTTPLGRVTRFFYDAAGNRISMTEPNGTVLRYAYDKSNRLLRTTYPGGSTETMTYDPNGNVVEKKAFELDDFYVYDGLDRVIQTRQVFLDASLTVWHNYTYDTNGNRLSMDGNGGGSYVWDKNNRISSETDNAGSRWTYAYGKDGQLLKETYPNGSYVTYAYDRDGRLVLETTYQPDGSLLEKLAYVYDKVGNVVTQLTPQTTEAVSSWSYSSCCAAVTNGLTVSGLNPSPQTVTVSVTAAGILDASQYSPPCPYTTITWYYILNGVATQIAVGNYQAGNNNICYVHFTGTHAASLSIKNGDVLQGKVTYENDSIEITTVSSLSVSFPTATNPTTYVYDKEYRLYKVTYPDGSSTKYTFDAVGNRLTSTSGGTTVTYAYDADNELTSSTDGASYTYNTNGDLVSKTLGLVTTSYAYDYASHLAPVSTTQLVSSSCSACDTTSTVRLLTLLPSPQSKTITVTGSGILTDDADYPNCPTVTVTWQYLLNGVGHQVGSQSIPLVPNNRFLTCHASFSGSYSSASPVALHSNDQLAGQVVVAAGPSVAVGNTATSLAAGTLNVAPYAILRYGPSGLLASETVNQGSTTVHYGYDLLGMGGLPQRVAEYAGTTPGTTYFYGVGSDRPLDLIVGGVSYYYHRDVLGTITELKDASGTFAAAYHLDAYGNLLPGSADTVGNPLRFTGLATDSTTGLVYARARWYDPTTGRFLTPDPLGGGYAYANDNPVNYVDPTGKVSAPASYVDWADGPVGCTMAMEQSGQCGPLGGQAGSSPHSSEGFSWDRCGLPIALFAVGIVLAVAGLYVGDVMSKMRLAEHLTGGSWDNDLAALVVGSSNLWDKLQLIWDIGSYLIFDVLIPAMSWWQQVLAVGEEFAEWTPPGLAVHLPLAFMSIGMGVAGLVTEDCIP